MVGQARVVPARLCVAEEIEAVDDFHGLQPCPSVRHSQGGPIYRPKNVAPQEAVPMLMGAMGQWVEKYGKRFSTLEFWYAVDACAHHSSQPTSPGVGRR